MIGELDAVAVQDEGEEEDKGKAKGGSTLLDQLEGLQIELGRLEVSLAWISAVERVVVLRYILSRKSWKGIRADEVAKRS